MVPARDIGLCRSHGIGRLSARPVLAIVLGVAACAPTQNRRADMTPPAGRTVAVSCTMQTQAGAPCQSEARQPCGSDAQLAGIISAVEIPMPVGPDQRGRSTWRYQARYRCS